MKEAFEKHGAVERVKKIKDYGFVHFEERDGAVAAMEALNGTVSIWIYFFYFCKNLCMFLEVCEEVLLRCLL